METNKTLKTILGKLRLTVTPYSFNKNLFEAYNDVFSLVNDDDWVCFIDGDVAFLEMSDFGHLIQGYIDRYPETGMFTCYASRCHYGMQKRKGVSDSEDSIKYYARKSVEVRKELGFQVKPIKRRIAGHLIVIKKSVWNDIAPILKSKIEKGNKRILGFDTQLSYSIMEKGYDILLMRGILVFHYLRMLNGKNDKIE